MFVCLCCNGQRIVFDLHGEGNTAIDIAVNLRCSKTAVHNAIVELNAGGTIHDRKKVWSSTKDYAHGRSLNEIESNALTKELL